MASAHTQHRLGMVLVTTAAVAWSTAPFFTRLLPYDSWTILFWRGLFGGAAITAVLVYCQGAAGLRALVTTGREGWLVATLSTLAMVAFIPSLQWTDVANVAVISAAVPFLAAALAWVWLREATPARTLLASFVALCGIAVIMGGTRGAGDVRGIGLACLMTVSFAAMTVAIRRHRRISMVAAAALSNFLGTLVSIPFASGIATVTAHDMGVFALFGIFQVGVGLTLFMLGSRLLPASQASLIGTLEAPLMPFWVWLAFREVPTTQALIGGTLVIGAVVADILAGMQAERQSAGPSGSPGATPRTVAQPDP